MILFCAELAPNIKRTEKTLLLTKTNVRLFSQTSHDHRSLSLNIESFILFSLVEKCAFHFLFTRLVWPSYRRETLSFHREDSLSLSLRWSRWRCRSGNYGNRQNAPTSTQKPRSKANEVKRRTAFLQLSSNKVIRIYLAEFSPAQQKNMIYNRFFNDSNDLFSS